MPSPYIDPWQNREAVSCEMAFFVPPLGAWRNCRPLYATAQTSHRYPQPWIWRYPARSECSYRSGTATDSQTIETFSYYDRSIESIAAAVAFASERSYPYNSCCLSIRYQHKLSEGAASQNCCTGGEMHLTHFIGRIAVDRLMPERNARALREFVIGEM